MTESIKQELSWWINNISIMKNPIRENVYVRRFSQMRHYQAGVLFVIMKMFMVGGVQMKQMII